MSEPTEKDIKDIEALFGSPVTIPGEFARWMSDQFALAVPSIPITQLFGARTIERLIDIETNTISVSGGTETTIYETALPAKSIARNGRLKVLMPITLEDAAAARTGYLRVKLNGSTVHAHPVEIFSATPDAMDATVLIWNRDEYTRQMVETRVNYPKFCTAAAVDLSADATLTVTYQHTGGDANDILVRKAAFATLYNPSE